MIRRPPRAKRSALRRHLAEGAIVAGAVLAPRFLGRRVAGIALRGVRETAAPGPFRIMRVAQRLHPELKGTVRIVRSLGMEQGNASATPDLTGLYRLLRQKPPYASRGKVITAPFRERYRNRGGKILARGGRMSGPTLAHELGHLSRKGRVMPGRPQLYEEARAHWRGAKIYREAGGRSRDYWREAAPAYSTYVLAHPATAVASGSLGLTAVRRRRRRGR